MSYVSIKYINDHQQRAADFLQYYWPFRFFLTLTFNHICIDRQAAVHFGGVFVRRMSKKLFGRSASAKCQPLEGIAVLEHGGTKSRLKRDRSHVHLHFLIKDHPIFDRNLVAAYKQIREKAETAALGINLDQSKKLVSRSGFDTTPVLSKGIIEYLTKEAAFRSWWTQPPSFFYLDREGLLEISVAQIRSIRALKAKNSQALSW